MIQEINTSNQQQRFKEKLDRESRVILSAGYGQGKTTFIQQFRNRYHKDYLFVTLYPVNYSVASNENIFEYIKRDILVHLMPREDNLEILESLVKKTWGAIRDPEIVGSLFKSAFAIASIPLNLGFFTPIIKELTNDCSIVKRFRKAYNKTIGSPKDVLDKLSQEKGGLYEDDAVTKLIRELLIANKETRNKQGDKDTTVLIIDDLDRLDPNHLFRILNILAAHVDYISGDTIQGRSWSGIELLNKKITENKNNKFGFDKIVTIFDYEATRELYQHLYGTHTYEGYIGKFKVAEPFRFDISNAAIEQLYQYIQDSCNINATILDELIKKLSVREISQILYDIDSSINYKKINDQSYVTKESVEPVARLLIILKRMNLQDESIIEVFNNKDSDKGFFERYHRVMLLRDCYLLSTYIQTNIIGWISKKEFSEEDFRLMAGDHSDIAELSNSSKWYMRFQIQELEISKNVIRDILYNYCQ